MNFNDKLTILNNKKSFEQFFVNNNDHKLLPKKFLLIYNLLLLISYFNDDIIKKIFYFYLLKEYQIFLKVDFSVPEIKDNREYLLFLNKRKYNIIDNILLSSVHNKIFLNTIFNNMFDNIFNANNQDIIKDIVIKITYLNNSKEILLNTQHQQSFTLLDKIFINKNFLSEIFINKLFQIFNFDDFKKYKILHKIPKEYLLMFLKKMNRYKINQDLILLQDDEGNTVLHKILNDGSTISFIKPIWLCIKKSIKNKLYKITNNKKYSIYNLADNLS